MIVDIVLHMYKNVVPRISDIFHSQKTPTHAEDTTIKL
jgi:hypothetical protein